jgi:hypothetical protein
MRKLFDNKVVVTIKQAGQRGVKAKLFAKRFRDYAFWIHLCQKLYMQKSNRISKSSNHYSPFQWNDHGCNNNKQNIICSQVVKSSLP